MQTQLILEKRDLGRAVGRAFDLFSGVLTARKQFLLKPNVVFPVGPRSGEITRPAMLRAVVRAIRERVEGADILVAEGTAAGTDASENFSVSGVLKLTRELGVELVDLESVPRRRLEWSYGPLMIPEAVFDRTYISLPILKPSSAAGISGAMKVQKGLLLDKTKKLCHHVGISDAIIALNEAVQPDMTILDGVNFFKPIVLLVGGHTVSIDRAACCLLGIEAPAHVSRHGTTGSSPAADLAGDDPAHVQVRSRPKHSVFKEVGGIRLWANPSACSMCRYVFFQLKAELARGRRLGSALKLARHAWQGADIVFGKDPEFVRTKSRLICMGNCTRPLSHVQDCIFISGCPPTVDDLAKRL